MVAPHGAKVIVSLFGTHSSGVQHAGGMRTGYPYSLNF